MTSSLAARLAELETMDRAALQVEWRRLFRSAPPSLSSDLLMRALGYRIQELEQGGLSKVALRRLRSVAEAVVAERSARREGSVSEGLRRRAVQDRPTLLPGARLIREWHGRTHVVTVSEDGFDYAGKRYGSLSEIAREITGTRWSGPRFFGLATSANGRSHRGGDSDAGAAMHEGPTRKKAPRHG